MIGPITVDADIHFERRGRGSRRVLKSGIDTAVTQPIGRLARVTRLMALAIRFDKLIQTGAVTDYAELSRLGHVTRARVTQIMNLLMLAPDIQEAILFLPRVTNGRDPIHLRQLQPIALLPDWRKQRRLWRDVHGLATLDPLPVRTARLTVAGDDKNVQAMSSRLEI